LGLSPLWISNNVISAKAEYAGSQVNKIAVDIATQQTKFIEVETQFKGVSKEIQSQIDFNKENNSKNAAEIEHLRETVNGINGGTGLQDRVSKTEQRLDDHDRYLWPLIQDHMNQAAGAAPGTSIKPVLPQQMSQGPLGGPYKGPTQQPSSY